MRWSGAGLETISGKEGLMYLFWRRHRGCERFAFEHEKTLAGKRMDFFFFKGGMVNISEGKFLSI